VPTLSDINAGLSEHCPLCGKSPTVLDRDLVTDALTKTKTRLPGLLLAQCDTLHLNAVRARPATTREAALANWNRAVRAKNVDEFWRHLQASAAIRINGGDLVVWFEWTADATAAAPAPCLTIRSHRGAGVSLSLTIAELESGGFDGAGEYVVASRDKGLRIAFFSLAQFGNLQLGSQARRSIHLEAMQPS